MTTLADVPSSYLYITGFLGDALIANAGWDDGTYVFIAEEALEAYGVDTEAEATDTDKLHVLLRYKALERFLIDTSADFDYSSDGESFKRSQVFEMVKKMFEDARRKATPYLSESEIEVDSIDAGYNPYLRSQ